MNKRNHEPGENRNDPAQREQRSNSRVTLRILLALYLAYLIYQMIQGYRQEGEFFLIIAALFFSVVEGIIVVSSLRQWSREQQRINELWAEQGEAIDLEDEAGEAEEVGEEDHS